MKKIILASTLTLLLFNHSWGFDGKRKGFILGGGIGAGFTSFTEELGSVKTKSKNEGAFMLDFKIGFGPDPQVEIVYNLKGAWFEIATFGGSGSALVLHSAAVNYFLKPDRRSLIISCGIGLATLTESLSSFADSIGYSSGFGFFVGGGYEFVKHLALKMDLMYCAPQTFDRGLDYTFKGFTPRISLIATAF